MATSGKGLGENFFVAQKIASATHCRERRKKTPAVIQRPRIQEINLLYISICNTSAKVPDHQPRFVGFINEFINGIEE
jgi:hypothetical protein